MLTLGIDDAGRGPLIGPMILAGVLVNSEQEKLLKRYNVRDSKQVIHPERTRLAKLIKENSLADKVEKLSPNEIDSSIKSGTNLNTLEAQAMAKIINEINKGKYTKEKIKIIVDCPSVNIKAWTITLRKYIRITDNIELFCEHKADANHVSVSAASIIAKVQREEEITKIKKEFSSYGDTGSGYPSDPITQEFLKKNGNALKDSGLFRKTWATWKALFPDKQQSTLQGF